MKAVDRIVYAVRWRERRRERETTEVLEALGDYLYGVYTKTLVERTGIDYARLHVALARLEGTGDVGIGVGRPGSPLGAASPSLHPGVVRIPWRVVMTEPTGRGECLTRSGSLRHLVGDREGRTVCGYGIAYWITSMGPDFADLPLHARCVDPKRDPDAERRLPPKPGRGTCPTCLTTRALTIDGSIRTHNKPVKPHRAWDGKTCPGSHARPLVGDRVVARAKALREARDALDFTLTAASAAYERARQAYDHTIRGARGDYDRQLREIYDRYGVEETESANA